MNEAIVEKGFVKTFRRVQEHWTSERPEWYQAWSYIIQDAAWRDNDNFKRGELNLTEVYRKLSKFFTKDSWRYFIKRLVKDEMLQIVETQNKGKNAGFAQVALVVNYSKYHDEKHDKAHENSSKQQDAAQNAARTQLAPLQERSTMPSQTEEMSHEDAARTLQERCKDAAQNAVYKEVFIPKEVKEVKEAKLEAFFVFEKIHPNYATRLSQDRDFDYEHWLDYWGDEQLGELLRLAVKHSNGTAQSVANTWYWYIIGDRVAQDVIPKSVKAKEDDYWERLANLPEPETISFEEWKAKN